MFGSCKVTDYCWLGSRFPPKHLHIYNLFLLAHKLTEFRLDWEGDASGKARPQQGPMVKNMEHVSTVKTKNFLKKKEQKKKSQSVSLRRTSKNSKEAILSATCSILLYSDRLWEHHLPTFLPTNRTEWTPQATVPSRDTKCLILKKHEEK